MGNETKLNESIVGIIADIAGLPLTKERLAMIAAPLSIWLADANELDRKMSEAKFWEVVPATVFRHSGVPGVRK